MILTAQSANMCGKRKFRSTYASDSYKHYVVLCISERHFVTY